MTNVCDRTDRAPEVRLRVADFLHARAADHAQRDGGDEACHRQAVGLATLARFVECLPPSDPRLQVLAALHGEDGPFTPLNETATAEVDAYAATWPACDHVDATCALVVGVGLELSADAWLTRFVEAETHRHRRQRPAR